MMALKSARLTWAEITIESLYLSSVLAESLKLTRRYSRSAAKQLALLEEKGK